MKTLFRLLFAMGVLLGLSGFSGARADSPDDLLIIANKMVEEDSLTASTVRSIFLKRRSHWQGGSRIVAINDRGGTALRETFQERILDMSARREAIYWEEQKIKTGAAPPAEMSARLKAVFKIQGAISYVLRSEYKSGVAKILLVIPASR